MKQKLDFKSAIIGFLCAALVTVFISFKNSGEATTGRYQTTIGESGVVILDTQTGAYIMSSAIASKWKWVKGNFESNTMGETVLIKD
ncbi:MAG: hypothetical protein H7Y03_07495 [Chitinophagaceae bacterium]|nr:hypothetical protein [Chitinophagaceae bacterium]